MRKNLFSIFKIVYLFLFVFFLSNSFSLAQTQPLPTITNNATTISGNTNLGFPYPIDFTENEIKLLLNLDTDTLKKLIVIATLLKSNREAEALKKANEIAGTDTYSNSYSPKTPYRDPQTGIYSSKPPQNTQQTQSENGNLPSQSNPFLGGLGSGMGSALQQYLPRFAGSDFNGPASGVDIDFSTVCKTNSGVGDVNGKNNKNWEDIHEKLKKDTLTASAAVGKTFKLVSGRRSQAQQDSICARGGNGAKACGQSLSCHVRGCAVDLGFDGLTEAEKVKAILVFLSFGYSIITYGPETGPQENKHVHIGMDGGQATWLTVQSNGDAPLYVKKAFLLARISQKRLPRSTVSENANLALKQICK